MITKVKVKDILPNPFQVRRSHDPAGIISLADEIRQKGLWAGAFRGRQQNGQVELCFGHRRLDAVKRLGWKEVEVDIVKLSDEEMSLQGLIENVQREGLNDTDKGEWIAAYIKRRLESGNIPYGILVEETRRLLGYREREFQIFLRLAGLSEPAKEKIRGSKMTGRAADEARRLAGKDATPEQVEEVIKNAAENKIGTWALESMGKKIGEIKDEKVREKVREKVVKGELTSPEEVVKKARQLQGQNKKKSAPPDLLVVVSNWTVQIGQWNQQLDQVTPYVEYIDTAPAIAENFRAAVRELKTRLEKFL